MKMYSWQEVEVLVKKAKLGDKEALEKVIKCFEWYIYKSALNIYVSGYDQEDLMQIGYMTVMKAVDNYDIKRSNFTGYVTLSITNNFRCLIRNKARENSYVSLENNISDGVSLKDMLLDENLNLEDDYIEKERNIFIREAIHRLPFKLKEIIDYVYIKEKGNLKEYAKVKGINYNTVVKRKNLAFEKIKIYLKTRNY